MKPVVALSAWLLIAVSGSHSKPVAPSGMTSVTQPDRPSRESESDTVRYSYMDDVDLKLGFGWAWTAPDGERQYYLEYNDRGRITRLLTRVRVDASQLPVYVHTTGSDRRRNAVDEIFQLSGRRASWKSMQESGDTVVSAPALYLPLTEVPNAVGVQALLAAPGQHLKMLPQGEARLTRVEEISVGNGRGESRRVVLYAISGIDFRASLTWLDQDGTLFSDGELIREGWESALPAINSSRVRFRAAEANRLIGLRRVVRTPIVIRHARLFNPATRSVTPGTTIVIEGSRIRAVGPDGSGPLPREAMMIDAAGKMVLPGLWDSHMHRRTADDAALNLASGITSVRDPAADTMTLKEERQPSALRDFRPRIVMSGLIEGEGPDAYGPMRVRNAEEARFLVNRFADLGAAQVKLYNLVPGNLVPIIIEEAHRRGLRVAGHVPRALRTKDAILAGQDEIIHLHYLFNAFGGFETPPADPIDALRRQGALDPASDSVRRFAAWLHERNVAVDPTLGLYEIDDTVRPGELPRFIQPVADRLPPLERRSQLVSSRTILPAGNEEAQGQRQVVMKGLIRTLHDAGVPLLIGTDREAGWLIQREFELYVEAGIPAPDVLYLATLGASKYFHLDRDLGTVEPGKLADLIMIDGNPLARMSDIRRVVLTVKDGVIYDPAELHRALGVQPCCVK